MREVDCSERTAARRWREIKSHLREDLIPWTRHLLKRLLEGRLEEDLEPLLAFFTGPRAHWRKVARRMPSSGPSARYAGGRGR